MNGDDVVPFRFRHVEDHAVPEDTGAGYNDVQLAEVIHGRLDDLLAAFHLSDRLHAGDGVSAIRLDLVHHQLGHRLVFATAVHVDTRVNDHHAGAFGSHEFGDASANATAGAGDDGHFSI